VISGFTQVFCVGISGAGTSVAADAPVASDNDNPAAPNNGTAHARLFRFEDCFARDMMMSTPVQSSTALYALENPCGAGQVPVFSIYQKGASQLSPAFGPCRFTICERRPGWRRVHQRQAKANCRW
jgi:hypothetical protein